MEVFHAVIMMVFTQSYAFVKTQTVHLECMHFTACNVDQRKHSRLSFAFFMMMPPPCAKKMVRAPATTKSEPLQAPSQAAFHPSFQRSLTSAFKIGVTIIKSSARLRPLPEAT